jgi:hypothetical protein
MVSMKNLKVKNCFQNVIIDGRIILNYISNKEDGRLWAGFFGLRIRTINRPIRSRR